MSSKLITVNSFVKVSFLCDFEMSTTKMCDRDALSFLMKFDFGKYKVSSLIGDTSLNSVYQVNPLASIVNSVVTTHLSDGSAGLVVTVEDYNINTHVEPEFKLPWVSIAESVAVSTLKTNFCNLKLIKLSDNSTYTFKGDVPTFATQILCESYGSSKAAYAGFEDTYRQLLELYIALVEKAGASCLGLPNIMPNMYTIHTEVGDVTVYRDIRFSKYGDTTHTVHMPWKSFAIRVCFKGTEDLQEWIYKELIEALWVELDIY